MRFVNQALAVGVSMLMAASLCACSSGSTTTVTKNSNSSSATDNANQQAMSIDQKYSVENYLDFTLVKIQSTDKIEASMGSGVYYENTNSGETYIDIILDITNQSTSSLSANNIMTATAENAEGATYKASLYATEEDNNTDIASYTSVSPLSTARFHCGISVPESESALTIKLDINDSIYSCEYTLGETLANIESLAIGQTVTDDSYAAITLQNVQYTEDLLPSNTSGFYSHYAVNSTDSIYLVAKVDVTNYQSTAKQCDTFVSVKATYMDKYVYTGFTVVEDSDGKSFNSYESIDPLTTRSVYILIEVPKTVVSQPATLSVNFNNNEYSCTYAG